ncbi:MAG: hypothetical protein E4H13_06465 [Calditrichales bacterium]|nr:MAG: hypothetical protein E4H13_06465 [Calditrichales bacterium]
MRHVFICPVLTIILLLGSSQETVYAQDIPTLPISSIVIMGNEVTENNVILRELVVHVGDIPTKELIDVSRKRLMNLLLFNRVELNLYPQDHQAQILMIEVTERIYFYPVPILNFHERDWSKVSYGLGLVNVNFRGQAEQVWGGLWLGYRPGFGISFSDQWAGDSLHLSTGFGFTKTTYVHRTLDFEERHIFANTSLGKWWGYHFRTSLNFNYDRINVDPPYAALMHSGQNTEHTFGIQLAFRYDTRDLYFYPSSGWLNQFNIIQYGLFEPYNDYINLSGDIRKFLKIGPLIFAARLMQNSLFGQIPVYRINYIGFSERIRGHFYTVWEGRHIQMGSLETRFGIIPVQYFSMNLPGIPAQYLHNLKIGLSGALFIDSGIAWTHAEEYAIENFHSGFGMGLHFHLPYVEIMRLDYAFDRDFRGQLIFEIGVVF